MNPTIDFLKKALIRAIWTIAQTALGMLTVGMTLKEVDWLHIASVSAVAGIISILKSIVVGMPEAGVPDGVITIDMSNPDDPATEIDVGENDLEDLLDKGSIKLNVVGGKIEE